MNIKIMLHIMPWDIDYALLAFDKLKRSSYFINDNDQIYIDSFLNLSQSIIDWENSSLPKEFFIEKYKVLDDLIKSTFTHKSFIYEGKEVYGHLDSQKTIIEPHIDYYIMMCPDINFHEHLLYSLIEGAKQIKNEYFVLTPQIFKCWDNSCDVLVNDNFLLVPNDQCLSTDIHTIRHFCLGLDPAYAERTDRFKFAGWFDLYNKNFYEKLVPTLKEWKGYGPWDLYAMNICNIASYNKIDVAQYVLKNQVIWFEDVGCWKNETEYGGDGKPKTSYRKFLSTKLSRKNQRAGIEQNMSYYINNWVEYAKNTKLI